MASFHERRRDERYPFAATIEFSVNGGGEGDLHRAVTIDISRSGLCMYLMRPLTEGQAMSIRTSLPISHSRASVRWIERLEGDLYKAGLSFV